jgi:hypothetical protein
MIKLKELLTESKDSKYYDFQIKIPGENSWDNDDIVYYSTGGKLQKHTTSRDDNPLILNYRNVLGMVKAALRKATKDSTITIWDDSGKGKQYSFNKQSIKKIKR